MVSYGELRWQYGYATDEYGSSTVIRVAAGPSRYVNVLLRCHYDCYTVHHEYPRICTVRLRLVTTDADQARMQPRMTTVELRYTTIFQDFHAVQW